MPMKILILNILLFGLCGSPLAAETTPESLFGKCVSIGEKSESLVTMSSSLSGDDVYIATLVRANCEKVGFALYFLAGHMATINSNDAINPMIFNDACRKFSSHLKDTIKGITKAIGQAKSPGLVAETRDIRKLLEETDALISDAAKPKEVNKK